VPLSPALSGNTIYFHCAHQGLKLDIIKKNPKGHFVFVSKSKILSEKATVDYRSAMASGRLRIVKDPGERQIAYRAITDKYMKKHPEAVRKAIDKSDAKTTLVAMDIEYITAKGNPMSKKKKKIKLSSPIRLNGKEIKNRIVMPPMVRLGQKRAEGFLTKDDYEHYISRAQNGTGLIVVEATAVDKNGYSWKDGLALWDDKYIDGFKKLVSGIKEHGAVCLIQLQHGGFKSDKALTSPVSSSDYNDGGTHARAMTEEEADVLVEQFAQAALRALKAGFDGVELHGCHGYLINQFSCPAINHRDDKYAESPAFGIAIIKRVRELCGDEFIISVRTGIDSPTVKNSLHTALDYQNAGADILSVSAGIATKPFKAPKEWKHTDIAYMAYLVKQKAAVPVVAVSGITSRNRANALLKEGFCDMAAVGRNHLIHPDWARRALNREEISKCRHCKKGCYFFGTLKKCPAVEKGKKNGLIK
jgi:2,4-dienoyl-CoA reductase-like NADH-dependent reductase (Old Yellow Enzyme family)/nitroimidazol reductase NimA-like FMN-containing flavoprotein (pyridoxamine 5'-phosphate oxidase superfamily)